MFRTDVVELSSCQSTDLVQTGSPVRGTKSADRHEDCGTGTKSADRHEDSGTGTKSAD